MLVGVRDGHAPSGSKRSRSVVDNSRFFAIAVALDMLVIIAASVAAGVLYHACFYGRAGPIRDFAAGGTLAALLFTLPFIFRGQYSIEAFLSGKRAIPQLFNVWCYAFLSLAVLGVLTKTTDLVSRGWMLIFFFVGLLSVIQLDTAIKRWLRSGVRRGVVAARRLLLIGTPSDIGHFRREHGADACGAEIVATALLPENYRDECYSSADLRRSLETDLRRSLETAVELGRKREVTDVIALVGWQDSHLLSRITDACMDLPAAIHLGRLGAISRYPGLRIERLGSVTTLALVGTPMTTLQLVMKRVFDLAASSVALLLASPVLLIVALLVKLDSRGPVFFRQRRRGFNHKEFQIWKFRTMTTMDDGDDVVQARRDDARVTRIGAFLRRTNIDELPQLLNVIMGQMSLVGPRPHAVAHDKQYERCIERYGRRLNVKPGITGWAQINGFRGSTETESAMRDRVACDLYYIDNWSVVLDLYIMLMTVASKRAFRNAF